jgi:RND family efflux transporter MFP subunit
MSTVSLSIWPSCRARSETVRVAQVKTRDFRTSFEVTGTLVAQRRAELRALQEGQIERLTVDIGRRVAQGELLYEVRTTDFRLALQQAEAALSQARVAVKDREREKTRVENLLAEGSATGQMLDQATTGAEAAKAAAELATAARDRARQSLADCTVVAPFGGVITQRLRQQGEYVRRADPVLEITDLGRLDAELEIAERYAGRLLPATEVSLSVPASSLTLPGTLVAVNPKVDERSHTFKVKVAVENREVRMLAGVLVSATFRLPPETQQTAVPEAALQCDEGRCAVWVVDQGRARRQQVVEGEREEGWVLIRRGVSAGQSVVVEGTGALSDGVAVSVASESVSPQTPTHP